MPSAESFSARRRPSPGGCDSVMIALVREPRTSKTRTTVELRLCVIMVLSGPISSAARDATLCTACSDSAISACAQMTACARVSSSSPAPAFANAASQRATRLVMGAIVGRARCSSWASCMRLSRRVVTSLTSVSRAQLAIPSRHWRANSLAPCSRSLRTFSINEVAALPNAM